MSSSVYVLCNKMGKVATQTRRHFNKILVIVFGSIFFFYSLHQWAWMYVCLKRKKKVHWPSKSCLILVKMIDINDFTCNKIIAKAAFFLKKRKINVIIILLSMLKGSKKIQKRKIYVVRAILSLSFSLCV